VQRRRVVRTADSDVRLQHVSGGQVKLVHGRVAVAQRRCIPHVPLWYTHMVGCGEDNAAIIQSTQLGGAAAEVGPSLAPIPATDAPRTPAFSPPPLTPVPRLPSRLPPYYRFSPASRHRLDSFNTSTCVCLLKTAVIQKLQSRGPLPASRHFNGATSRHRRPQTRAVHAARSTQSLSPFYLNN